MATNPSDITGDTIMLTVFLRHDQSQHLAEFQAKLDARGWWERFPPEGVEIVSWNVVMGIGQIVTLRLPPSKLQAVNVELERSAWGVFRTEAFPTYDFVKVRERLAREWRARRGQGTNPPAGANAAPVNSGAGGGDHPRLPPNGLRLDARQAGKTLPSDYENRLGDALEEVFKSGIHDLAGIVAALNARGLASPDGGAWTEANFGDTMRRLGG
jgi:hypothetical protein